jgi:type III secretion system FlhB-like substrate exporter
MKGYDQSAFVQNFEGITKTFIDAAEKKSIAVESSVDKAQHMIKNDLRDAIPPQLFALISRITSAIEYAGQEEDA